MSEELKSCPFCGGNEVYIDVDRYKMQHHRGTWWAAECPDCGVRGPVADSRDKAARFWNEREENEE